MKIERLIFYETNDGIAGFTVDYIATEDCNYKEFKNCVTEKAMTSG